MIGLAAERYRALILTSPALVWRASPEGAILEGWGIEGNPAAFPAPLMGFGWMERIHPDDKMGVLAIWNRATTEGICPPIDYRIDRGQGGFRWVQVRTVALRGGDGSVREWIGTLADIHEERMAAAAFKVEQERLQLAVESTGLGIWDHEFASNTTWWSQGTKALLGWAEDDDAVGFEPLLKLVHPEDRAEFEKQVSRALEAGGNGQLHQELRIFRASDGAERWVLSVGRAFFDEAGMPTRFLGTLRDVTESRRTRDTLKGSEDRFRQVASTSPNACITIDQRGKITFWNRGAERIFGFAAAEAIGSPVDIIIPARFRSAHDAGLRRVATWPEYAGRTVSLTARHRDGREFPVEGALSTWMEGPCRHFGALLQDISARREQEERLYRLAHFDHLTNLPNRTLFWQHLDAAVADAAPAAVLVLDLDAFKDLNDSLGHPTGDQVLQEVAARLALILPEKSSLARLGGDEFALLLPGEQGVGAVPKVLREIRDKIAEPLSVQGRTVLLSAGIGVAIAPRDGSGAEELMANVDLALFQAKAEGRNLTRFFTPPLRLITQERQLLNSELHRAFENGEFELHYQPQVRLTDGKIAGAEALIRWRHPGGQLLPPSAFLTVLEQSPLAVPVGNWIVRTACAEGVHWGSTTEPIRMGVNLFAAQLMADDFVQVIEDALSETGLKPNSLELEITENVVLKSDERVVRALKRLREIGVGLAFDDYGTGHASLSMLKDFPITRLKIDKGFIKNVETDPRDLALVQAIIQLGRTFRLDVIAEGIETRAQEKLLVSLGCAEAQGYLYGRPMLSSHFREVIETDRMVARRLRATQR